jgi:hypothetical protein
MLHSTDDWKLKKARQKLRTEKPRENLGGKRKDCVAKPAINDNHAISLNTNTERGA